MKRLYSLRLCYLMNVLVIGDEHTYGYGLSGGKLSYIGHFIRQFSRAGQAVSVEVYANLTMTQIVATLDRLPLNRYDLIMLQLDDTMLQPADSILTRSPYVAVPYSPESALQVNPPAIRDRLKSIGSALLTFVWPLRAQTALSVLMKQLRPYRHNVLLMTPFPHRNTIDRWLRKRSRLVLLDEADEHVFSVFDTDLVIQPREEYFLTNDKEHLSAVSHELLGRAVFDFYQSAPTIVTIQAIRREE